MYKIKNIWVILIFLFFAILDITVLNYIKICDVKPDVFLIGVLFFALYGGFKTGALAGIFGGLIRDIFTGNPFGVNVLFLGLLGSVFGYNFSKFYRESPYAQFILSFLSGLLYLFFYYNLAGFSENIKDAALAGAGMWKMLMTSGVLFSLYTAIVAVPLFFVFHKIFRSKY